MTENKPKEGDLRVWWVPQVPMEAFYTPVESLEQAAFLIETLGRYDLFQYENRVKLDYSNAGGLEVWDEDNGLGWIDWYNEDGDYFDEWLEMQAEKEN